MSQFLSAVPDLFVSLASLVITAILLRRSGGTPAGELQRSLRDELCVAREEHGAAGRGLRVEPAQSGKATADTVVRLLGELRTEFRKFGQVLDRVKMQLHPVSNTIEMTGRRTRAVKRRLAAAEIPALQDGDGNGADSRETDR